MAKANSTSPRTPAENAAPAAKKTKAPKPPAPVLHEQPQSATEGEAAATPPADEPPIVIGALRIDYSGMFDEGEMPFKEIRIPLNGTARAIDGIKAIAKILYSNEIERSRGEEAECLDESTTYGLYEALLYLATGGEKQASELGGALLRQMKKGGAQ